MSSEISSADGDATSIDGVHLRFSRTDHPPPTVAVEIAHDGSEDYAVIGMLRTLRARGAHLD